MDRMDFIDEQDKFVNTHQAVTLYHGSKSGIHGSIAPNSRVHCDFGKGFYMGTDRAQSLTLICNYPNSKIYTLSVDLWGLKLLDIEVGLEWALLVAYNRGKMEAIKDSGIYAYFHHLSEGYDMIKGYIANDRMFVVLDRFFRGQITDIALIRSLSALKLGKQFVAVTEKACNAIKIVKEQELSDEDRKRLRVENRWNRAEGISLADEICRKCRREGQFFDEILEAGEFYHGFKE